MFHAMLRSSWTAMAAGRKINNLIGSPGIKQALTQSAE
jgi:hypothetical protein